MSTIAILQSNILQETIINITIKENIKTIINVYREQ